MADHQAQKEIRKHLRQGILEQRRALSPLDALNAGAEIVKVLKDHHYFTEKRMVGSYLSLGGELSTDPINEFLMQNHELALPHMNLKEKGLMDDEENIDEESLDKLLKIADMIEGINKKEN